MTRHVGMFEAKTTLSAAVRYGQTAVRLVPAEPELSNDEIARRQEAIKRLRRLSRELNIKATHEEIKSWVSEGRH